MICSAWGVHRRERQKDRPLATLIAELQEAVLVEGTKLDSAAASSAGQPTSTAVANGKLSLDSANAGQLSRDSKYLVPEPRPLQRHHQQRQHLVSKRRLRHTPMPKLVLHSLAPHQHALQPCAKQLLLCFKWMHMHMNMKLYVCSNV